MRFMTRGPRIRWILSFVLTATAFLAFTAPLTAQTWPHEQPNFSGDDSSQGQQGGKKASPVLAYQAAPNNTAWRGGQQGASQRAQQRFDNSQGFVQIDPSKLPAAREIQPIKPKGISEVNSSTSTTSHEAVTPKKKEKPTETAPYRLQIGDQLTISIYGETNTQRDVTVDRGGNITYPIVGTLEVIGKTIDEARREMNDRIRKVYRYTFVTVTPMQFGGENYTILGSINVPGQKPLLGVETVLSALCRSGGFPIGQYRNQTVDLADLDHAFLLRKGEYVPVDFNKLVTEGDLSQDVRLKAGDYIYIPSSLEKEIFVMGEVALPSAIGYINQVTLLEAIAMAGGTTFNASSRVLVVRGSLSEPYTFYIDFNRISKGCERDFLLKPGDIVYVPPRQFTNLREILQYAIRVFVSTAASDAGSIAWANLTNSVPQNNVNVIPNTFVAPTFTPQPIIIQQP